MSIAIITGAGGLVGCEAAEFFADKFDRIVGIDNNMRRYFFGEEASTADNVQQLKRRIANYQHVDADIRETEKIEQIFSKYDNDIKLVVHTAAQPSHDWAAKEPLTDFSTNANGTLTLLEMTRLYAPKSVFIHCSTNKVYGDTPNFLPLVEHEKRYEVSEDHIFFKNGIDETMSIDQSMHSLFGASKIAADILVQEYGKYFGLYTVCFRGGCLTGPKHCGAKLHGFLHYLMRCAVTGTLYTIYGYKGKQVRDNIHSADLVNMFWHFYQNPRCGEVYNAGGARHSNCSIIEAISICEEITDKKMNISYTEENRNGDHIWWISDISRFRLHYPSWDFQYSLQDTLVQIFDDIKSRVK